MSSRDPWLDNVKFVLVTVVIFGHSLALIPPTEEIQRQVYDFVYYWHMPAFVLLSGYLSRSIAWNRRRLDAMVATLLIPYLIFEPLLYWFRDWIGHELEPGTLILDPHWGMWYLIVLFVWRLATPILKLHWVAIPISIAISLAAGLLDTTTLALPRILGMLPFFVVGLHLSPTVISSIRSKWSVLPAALFMVLLWDFASRTDEWARTWFLLWNVGYAEMNWTSDADAMEVRLKVIVLAFAGIFSVLALVPRKEHFFTRLGQHTIVVYLGHLFLIRLLAQQEEWIEFTTAHVEWALIISLAGSVVLSLVLASPWSVRVLGPLTDPVGSLRALGWLPPAPAKSTPPGRSGSS